MIVLRPIVPVLEYAINYDYISKVLCENKQDPNSCCKGKCHLKKKLNEVFDDSTNSGASGTTKSTLSEEIIGLYFLNLPSFDFHFSDFIAQSLFNLKNQQVYEVIFSEDFFHPPTFLI